jgi:hypothetical protein
VTRWALLWLRLRLLVRRLLLLLLLSLEEQRAQTRRARTHRPCLTVELETKHFFLFMIKFMDVLKTVMRVCHGAVRPPLFLQAH